MAFYYICCYNIGMPEIKSKKLECIVTGRKLIATKEYYARKIEKAGGEEDLHRTYICREAKNLLKTGTSVDKVRDILGSTDTVTPTIDQEIINNIVDDSTRTSIRRINNIVSISNMINNKTDPEVKAYIKNITKTN